MTNDKTQFIRYHEPVLVDEVLQGLNVHEGDRYIDATLGDGGHTMAIIQRGGQVLGLDQDPVAIERTSKRLRKEKEADKLTIAQGSFEKLNMTAAEHGFDRVDGILFDLGMSRFQLESSGRGFSFQKDEPLDMRMDPTRMVTAADLVNGLSETELCGLFTHMAQVERARAIARLIVRERREGAIKTTGALAHLIEQVIRRKGRLHPATKVFMALRMAVNDELGSLERALPQACELLVTGARLVVISFHEGEDRIVKQCMKENPRLAMITKKPVTASDQEQLENPWARSAKLRIAKKTEGVCT